MVRKKEYKYKFSKDELLRLYIIENKSTMQISKIYGCSDETIRCRLKRHDIPVRKHKELHPSEDAKEKTRKKAIERWKNPDFRKKQIEIINRTSLPVMKKPECRIKASETRKRNYKEGKIKHPFLGKNLSNDHKKSISRARIGKKYPNLSRSIKESFRSGKRVPNCAMLGKHHSREAREKISEANKGKKQSEEWKIKRFKASAKTLNLKPIPLERRFIDIIQKNNLPFKYVGDRSFWIGGINPDFVHTNGKKVVIEIFGEYWHSPILNPKLALSRTYQGRKNIFKKEGWIMIVFWEFELKIKNTEQLVLNRLSGIM